MVGNNFIDDKPINISSYYILLLICEKSSYINNDKAKLYTDHYASDDMSS